MVGYFALFVLVVYQVPVKTEEIADISSRQRRQIVTSMSTVSNVTYIQPTSISIGNLTASGPLQDTKLYPLPQFLRCLEKPSPGDDCCLSNQEIVCFEPLLKHIEHCSNMFFIHVGMPPRSFECECKETTMECERKRPNRERRTCNRLSRIFTRKLDGLDCEHGGPNVEISTSSSTSTTQITTPSTKTNNTTKSRTKTTPLSTNSQYLTSTMFVIVSGGLGAFAPNEADTVSRSDLIGGVFGGIFIGVFLTLVVLAILFFVCGLRKRIDFRNGKTLTEQTQAEDETALAKPVVDNTRNYHIYELPDLNGNNSNPTTGSSMAPASGNTNYDKLGDVEQRLFKPSARYDAVEIVGTASSNKVINNDYDHTISKNDGSSTNEKFTFDSPCDKPSQPTCAEGQNDIDERNGVSIQQPTGPYPYSLATAVNMPKPARETSL